MQEMQETGVRSLGWEDPLEEKMATPSSTLAWKIPKTEEPGGLQSTGLQRAGHDLATEHNNKRILKASVTFVRQATSRWVLRESQYLEVKDPQIVFRDLS